MASRKLSASTVILGSAVDQANDLFMILDVSDTTDAASGTNKKIIPDQMPAAIGLVIGTDVQAAMGADDNYVTDAEKTMIGYISVTQAVDLDTIETLAVAALPTTGGTMTGALNRATWAAIADSATPNLGAAAGDQGDVNGTTTITGFVKTDSNFIPGSFKIVTFQGVRQLTHHATDFILPNSENITTAVGDIAIVKSLTGANKTQIVQFISSSGEAENTDNKVSDFSTPASTTLYPNNSALQNTRIATITFIIDGGGSPISTGIKGDLEIPFACTIDSLKVLADQSGSIVIDIWKDTYANFPPTGPDTITASAKPTISGATKATDTTLTGWTTAITAGDILRFNVDSATTVTRVVLSLKVTKT